MPDLPNPPDEKTLIQAVLARREGADKELRLVVEGAMIDSESRDQRFSLAEHDIEWIPTAQLARRLKRLGPDRMKEVFAILAPGLESGLTRTWEWMCSRPQRFQNGFCYPNDSEKKGCYEAWWLSEIFKDMTRFPVTQLELASRAGVAEVGGNATDAAADYLACSVVAGVAEGEEIMRQLKSALKGSIVGVSVTRLIANALVRIPRQDGWEALCEPLLDARPDKNIITSILDHAYEGGDDAFHFLAEIVSSRVLLRHPAALKAFNLWIDANWKVAGLPQAKSCLEKFCRCLMDSEHCAEQMHSDDAESYYLALWVKARQDADDVADLAMLDLRQHPSVERRFAALRFLLHVDSVPARQAVCSAVGDSDLRIACHATAIIRAELGVNHTIDKSELSKNCANLLARIESGPKSLPPLLWPWFRFRPNIWDVVWLRPDESLLKPVAEEIPSPSLKEQNDLDFLTIEKLRSQTELLPIDESMAFWRNNLIAISARYEAIKDLQIREVFLGIHDSDESPFPCHLRDLRWAVMDELVAKWPEEALRLGSDWTRQDAEPQLTVGMELLKRLCDAKKHVNACRDIAQAHLMRKGIFSDTKIPRPLRDVLKTRAENSVA